MINELVYIYWNTEPYRKVYFVYNNVRKSFHIVGRTKHLRNNHFVDMFKILININQENALSIFAVKMYLLCKP